MFSSDFHDAGAVASTLPVSVFGIIGYLFPFPENVFFAWLLGQIITLFFFLAQLLG